MSFIGEPLGQQQKLPEPWQAMTPPSRVEILSHTPPPDSGGIFRRGYVPPAPPPPPAGMDPGIEVGNGSLFGIDGFWPRIIVGFAVGGALAWLIPTLMAPMSPDAR